MKGLSKFINSIAEGIYKYFGKNSGKMLLTTSIIGISMSSLIQAMAILVNDKYSNSQKKFMVPQELGEAMISIISIFLITKPIQKFASNLTKTAKIAPKNVINYLKENNIEKRRGLASFNFRSKVENTIKTIENSDKYIKSSSTEKAEMLAPHKNTLHEFDDFADSTQAYATLVAGILSTSYAVPLIRNNIASRYQPKQTKPTEILENPTTKNQNNTTKTLAPITSKLKV